MAAISSFKQALIEHVHDQTVDYEEGFFKSSKDETIGQCPLESYPEKCEILTLKNLEEVHESVLRVIKPGIDGRRKVEDTKRFPFCIHVHMEMLFPHGEYSGSGSIVGPQHILTCAHNVYDISKKFFAQIIHVYPGRNSKEAPFGKAKVTKTYVFKEWTTLGIKQFDIALLVLDKPIGLITGWGAMCHKNDGHILQKKFHITGYPGDKPDDTMWTMQHTISKISNEILEYQIDTFKGQSGSAIWINKPGKPTIYGVHTNGVDDDLLKNIGLIDRKTLFNKGVRINKEKLNFFSEIISKTYQIKGSTTPVPSNAFGKAKWSEFFGDIGAEPSLPPDIQKTLNSSCPFWEGKKISDTHLLILVPQTIDGQAFNLDKLSEIIKIPKKGFKASYVYYNDHVKKELGKKQNSSHWILVTKDVIPNSRGQKLTDQKALIKSYSQKTNIPYTLLTSLELATAVLTEHAKTGTKLFSNNPWTYSWCEEKVNQGQLTTAIGGFSSEGLYVHGYDYGYEDFGVACGWRIK